MQDKKISIGIAGAGSMGSGIAQVAAMAGHPVRLYDTRTGAAEAAVHRLKDSLDKLAVKGKIGPGVPDSILKNVSVAGHLEDLAGCSLVIEAIIEELPVKQGLFQKLEEVLDQDAVIATNTSSLSVSSIASVCKNPGRVIGIHFFNPAFLMPLVEIIPAIQTDQSITRKCEMLIRSWNKTTVIAKDTPGFIVNRVARPFYGEALRIAEERIASFEEIDTAMRSLGFKMGPFELMDLIGNDVNYAVTEAVWTQCYYDPRYKPSVIQRRMVDSGRLGRKSGRGYYSYDSEGQNTVSMDEHKQSLISNRILSMLINEAADAVYYGIASIEDIDLAMTKGVNYPKGLLKWADETGISNIVKQMDELRNHYNEDRYRCSPLLRTMASGNKTFYN